MYYYSEVIVDTLTHYGVCSRHTLYKSILQAQVKIKVCNVKYFSTVTLHFLRPLNCTPHVDGQFSLQATQINFTVTSEDSEPLKSVNWLEALSYLNFLSFHQHGHTPQYMPEQ
jgi:hypothetical protein